MEIIQIPFKRKISFWYFRCKMINCFLSRRGGFGGNRGGFSKPYGNSGGYGGSRGGNNGNNSYGKSTGF